MRRLVGLGWWRRTALLFGMLAAGTLSLLGCGSDRNNGGSAGATAGGSSGTNATGGSASNAGAGGSAVPGGAPSAGAGGGAGASGPSAGAGAGGGSTTEKELAVSFYACKPDCPEHQYCALLGPQCATEPCLVHAVCRERPVCGADKACPIGPVNFCRDDPSDACKPGNISCPGRCFCGEGPISCGDQVLDRRPDICACVTPGPLTVCLDVECPGDDVCEIVLGKAYCVSP